MNMNNKTLANSLLKKIQDDFTNQSVDTYTYDLAIKYNQLLDITPSIKNRLHINLDRINY